MTMLERTILFGVPTLAGLAVGFVLLGPGARRVVEGARVFGLPVEGAAVGALRIALVRRLGELEVPTGGRVEVEWSRAGEVFARSVATVDADGWADVTLRFDTPFPQSAHLTVRRGATVLATGDAEAHPSPRLVDASVCESNGPLTLCVPRGIAVPEFPERVSVTMRGGNELESGTLIELDAAGGRVTRPSNRGGHRCERGECVVTANFDVVALAPSVPLDVHATDASKSRLYAELPLRAGGLWLEPSDEPGRALVIRSATLKGVVYASFITAEGRSWGGAVRMQELPDGTATGRVDLPSPQAAAAQGATLVISSDAEEPKEHSVAWPVSNGQRREPALVERILDGVPAALNREEARIRAVRWPTAGAIATSSVAVLLTLSLRIRRMRERFERHLAGAGSDVPIPPMRLGLTIGVLVLVALALLVLAVVAAYG